ncbi:AraC family transcriptional regulator [Alteromonas sp. 5E99-2]|uniref:helix-turn-helix domain-containing protein n=1 Tax=Alteromonas sp. 5E99-2 TaxID=2817683 RepID=UPI001A99E17E|nr:helix-turn-helix domain-containing protein [Alteromonas sp. 5E99-2]MBO1254833.1 AraC family transcriptional regulator [Alteromonas sp. 5E99-2]
MFSFYHVLMLVGTTHGLVTSFLLLTSEKNKTSNRFLALGLFSFCLVCVHNVLITSGMNKTFALFNFFPMATDLACGPLFYFYILSLVTPKSSFNNKMLWHLFPFLFFQSYVTWCYFSVVDLPTYELKVEGVISLAYRPVKTLENYLTVVSAVVYIFMAYRKLSEYRKRVADNFSDSEVATFSWLKKVTYLFVLLVLLLITIAIVDLIFNVDEITKIHWRVLLLYLAGLVYYFGFAGYIQPEFKIPVTESTIEPVKASPLSQSQAEQLVNRLESLLQIEKMYLEPDLNSKELAQQLGTSQKNLSYIINSHYRKNFRELINSLRIEEVKSKLLSNVGEKYSILAIALESGFSSEASFYRVFKEHTGLTPKAFIVSQSKAD